MNGKSRSLTSFKYIILAVVAFFSVSALSSSASVGHAGDVQHVQFRLKGEELAVTYLLSDSNNAYFEAIQDQLKSGKRLHIDHEVNLYTLGAWNKHLAKKERAYFVDYDLLSNEYRFDEGDGNIYRTSDEDMLRAFLFTVKNLPLIHRNRLTTGDEYVVKFHSSFKEDTSKMEWYKRLNLALLRKTVDDEVIYIAR